MCDCYFSVESSKSKIISDSSSQNCRCPEWVGGGTCGAPPSPSRGHIKIESRSVGRGKGEV